MKEYVPFCDYFLFDAFGKNAGGNGIVFNWELLVNYKENTPFLLSGGINESMIRQLNNFVCILCCYNANSFIISLFKMSAIFKCLALKYS